MRSNGQKLNPKNIRENFIILRVAEPREVVQSSCLETFKTHLYAFLCHLLEVTLPSRGD